MMIAFDCWIVLGLVTDCNEIGGMVMSGQIGDESVDWFWIGIGLEDWPRIDIGFGVC